MPGLHGNHLTKANQTEPNRTGRPFPCGAYVCIYIPATGQSIQKTENRSGGVHKLSPVEKRGIRRQKNRRKQKRQRQQQQQPHS
ncbi:hypothetical protein M5D96_012278 [Drosophila gunungcola]|uniref:Uncharacterized protein n=1 Tax=Drosophila gunungcola TaxID=103775 RepID=A0A9P9YDH0_9MUSC|nr:hypothetical protein M5D96_012278 [Drosophila gunungcola]